MTIKWIQRISSKCTHKVQSVTPIKYPDQNMSFSFLAVTLVTSQTQCQCQLVYTLGIHCSVHCAYTVVEPGKPQCSYTLDYLVYTNVVFTSCTLTTSVYSQCTIHWTSVCQCAISLRPVYTRGPLYGVSVYPVCHQCTQCTLSVYVQYTLATLSFGPGERLPGKVE